MTGQIVCDECGHDVLDHTDPIVWGHACMPSITNEPWRWVKCHCRRYVPRPVPIVGEPLGRWEG